MQRTTAFLAAALGIGLLTVSGARAEDAQPGAWDVSLAVGATLTGGNSDTLAANTVLSAARATDRYDTRLKAEVNYGENTVTADDGSKDTEKTAQNATLAGNIKRRFGAPFAYLDGSLFHDKIAALDWRALAGAGGGLFLVDRAETRLSAEAGLTYLRESLENGDDQDALNLRIAARLDQAMGADAKVWLAAEYLPELQDMSTCLVNAEAGAEAAMNAHLNLRVVLQDRYDSEPPAGRDSNDVTLIGALAWKL